MPGYYHPPAPATQEAIELLKKKAKAVVGDKAVVRYISMHHDGSFQLRKKWASWLPSVFSFPVLEVRTWGSLTIRPKFFRDLQIMFAITLEINKIMESGYYEDVLIETYP